MIFKAYLTTFDKKKYELPHSNISVKKYLSGKATEVKISVIEKEFYPSIADVLEIVVDNVTIFQGKVFSYSTININTTLVAYDNITFLLQNGTNTYKNMTATQIIYNICKELNIETGDIIDTKFTIPLIELENTSFMDAINSCLEQTKAISGEKFILIDQLGQISLVKNSGQMFDVEKTNVISQRRLCDFSKNNYNIVKVEQKTKGGEFKYTEVSDFESVKKIGKLQKIIRVDRTLTSIQCREIAKNYLNEYSKIRKNYEIEIIYQEIIDITDKIKINSSVFDIQSLEISIDGNKNILKLQLV